MISLIEIVTVLELVLLFAFLAISLKAKRLKKKIFILGALLLIAGEALALLGEIGIFEFSFRNILESSMTSAGYLLLLVGFNKIMREGK